MVLDHATKSVVVSVRGSVSTADWVTDFLGIPEHLDEWLPDAFKEVTRVAGDLGFLPHATRKHP